MIEPCYQFPNDPAEILEFLELESPAWKFEFESEHSSTQILAKDAFKSGLRDRTVFFVRSQTAGRGRKDRSWLSSSEGFDLAMTLLIPVSVQLKNVAIMSLAGGISTAEALREITGKDFRVKWPNDICFQNSKVCGILSELLINQDDRAVAMGIGINVNSKADDFPQDEFMYAVNTVSSIAGCEIDLADLTVEILRRIDDNVTHLENNAVDKVLVKWDSIGWMTRRKIRFREISGEWERGIAIGISGDGHLVIRDIESDAVRTLIEGDVIPDDK
ncbi:biotin--[acetyl-CoA-carboxylase] ligase [bacterium]|nr:biotin--[acetyl-CoA-carboxylase] ligase [bacterium]